jgi:hypothetical protein
MNTISNASNLVRSSFRRCFSILLFFVMITASAVTRNVSSIAGLQNAINTSGPRDIIILADATYLDNTFNISHSNITIKATTPGGVFLNGTNANTISGSNVTFSGFQFTSNTTMTGSPVTVSGNSNTLTQLNFNGYSSDHMLYISGLNNIVSYCNFQKKPAIMSPKAGIGDLIQIIPDLTNPGYNKIQYCSFQKLPGLGGDFGNECIRIGNSTYATVISRTIVEYCYFEDTGLGDSETISVKSMENVIRYNTMGNNPKANFCFRNGNNNVAYGNFFMNSGGIRVKEANNIYCYNNYFKNCGDAIVSAPVKYVYVSPNLDNINFIHNTFIGGTLIELDTSTNNTWANNIFKKTSGDIFSGSIFGMSFAVNTYSGNLGVTINSGMSNVNPQLVINTDSYYGISSTSSTIAAASASYTPILDIAGVDDGPTLLFDISGQARPLSVTLKDVGCDESTTGTITNHPLILTEVGPSYLGGPGSKLNQTITFNSLPTKDIGDSDFSVAATASSGLAIAYASSNTSVATIVNGNIHIVGVGTTTITASQSGDTTYNAAINSTQLFTVSAAMAPSSNFNLADWKLQTINSSNTQTDILAPVLNAGYISPLFYTNTTDGSMVFRVPSNGGTTSGSTYPRLELRQMTGGANWALSDPTEHYLTAQCKVIDIATAKPKIIIGQIHGSETNSELLKIRWTGYLPGQCFIEARFELNDVTQAEYGVTLATGLSLGDMISYTVTMKNGTITCTVNGVSASQTYTIAYFGSTDAYYFKAGNYFQYNNLTVPDPTLIYGKTQFYKLSLQRQLQTISFGALPTKIVGNADFSPGASSNAVNLTVAYSSFNKDVATIVEGNIHILGAGTTTITASQAGDLTYSAASDVLQTLTVNKANQTITFEALTPKVVGDADFSPEATSDSRLTVVYASSNTAVATIVGSTIRIVGEGNSIITASQAGDGAYNAATNVSQSLSVTGLSIHTITFALPLKYTNSADFDPDADSSIGSPIVYTSSNTEVATIVNNKIHIIAKGTSNITASAVGNGSYAAASNVQQLIVQCSCVQ